MINKKTVTDYWFTIEPYVYVVITNQCVFLYNTLDKETLESDKAEVIELLQKVIQKENYGVILLKGERYQNKNINDFIRELREKYMGDIIDVALSKGKPVQLLPFFNFSDPNKLETYKRHNFHPSKNVLKSLFEISMHVNNITKITKLIHFLQSAPENLTFNIIGNIGEVANYSELLSFLEQIPSAKNIECSYTSVLALQPTFSTNFSYRVLIQFPLDMLQWDKLKQLLLNQTLPFKYVFNVSSLDDCLQVEQIVEQFHIEKYQINPVYTGDNIGFFEENVFLTKEDILSTSISIKDIFANQAVNFYDFGKINIMPNGDVYANVNHPVLGNIYKHSLYDLVSKEIDEGKSWFNVRNQEPCNNCVYQWLCPPPSNYEIVIGRPNLCHIKQ